jgi:hypothetical protein
MKAGYREIMQFIESGKVQKAQTYLVHCQLPRL